MADEKDVKVEEKKPGFWHKFGAKLEEFGLAALGAYMQGKGMGGGR